MQGGNEILTIIQVGHSDASDRYIRNKVKAVQEAGMEAEVVNLPEECDTCDVIAEIGKAVNNAKCRAIMVQLPLPSHIDKDTVMRMIPTTMDIDGLNPHSDFKPLTPCAIMRWFRSQGITLEGKSVSVLGRSELVGKPLANMLIDAGATVTVCNSHTFELDRFSAITKKDIVISAVGKAGFITRGYALFMNPKTILVDVGINRDENGNLCGDVTKEARDAIKNTDIICTPVPGGVGKWTVNELVLRLKQMEGVGDGQND